LGSLKIKKFGLVYQWKNENLPVVFADSMTNNRTGEGDRRGGRTLPWNYTKWKVTIFLTEKRNTKREGRKVAINPIGRWVDCLVAHLLATAAF
jgi:hypothetical protein